MTKLPSKPTFVLEMANNHMGDVEHGLRLIRAFAAVCKDYPQFAFGFKMQYRQLDTLIHPDFRDRMDIKYIQRFSQTVLSVENLRKLVAEIKAQGFIAICTPFDEASVDRILEDGFDVLKVASCSFTDWPLLERIGQADKPVIASTGGAEAEDIDNVVSFFKNRKRDLSLLHCVAEYPTPDERLQINQIDFLRARYPGITVGFSTHEEPDATLPITVAIAKGCRLFEKHVGLPTDTYAINGYSATPEQVRGWLQAAVRAFALCGIEDARIEPSREELASLFALRRGVYAVRDIAPGERVRNEDVQFAIPTQDGHVTANDWSKYQHFYATEAISAGKPVLRSNTRKENVRNKVWEIVQRVSDLLKAGNVVVPGEAALEISHHYGIDRFDEFGITMVTVVNRGYCKKLIAVLPGQKHPDQYHKRKEETFHVLHGTLIITLDGVARECRPGAVIVVERGVHHAFESTTGAVFEEISSTHEVDDSFYTDTEIGKNPNRKTFLSYWMR